VPQQNIKVLLSNLSNKDTSSIYIFYLYLFLFFVTLGQIAKVVVEFLEVAINCIVFLKGCYPSSISHANLGLIIHFYQYYLSIYLNLIYKGHLRGEDT
jgi:hypothetical protein